MYGLEEPENLEALLGETTVNRAELVDALVLLDFLRAVVGWNGDGGGGGNLFKWYSQNKMAMDILYLPAF